MKRGRPRKAPSLKRDYPISVWLTPDLRARLQAEADKKGRRKLSAEIAIRLEWSLEVAPHIEFHRVIVPKDQEAKR